jgi:hypothetical protein
LENKKGDAMRKITMSVTYTVTVNAEEGVAAKHIVEALEPAFTLEHDEADLEDAIIEMWHVRDSR